MHAIKKKFEILFWGSPGMTERDEVQTPLAASAGITGNSNLPAWHAAQQSNEKQHRRKQALKLKPRSRLQQTCLPMGHLRKYLLLHATSVYPTTHFVVDTWDSISLDPMHTSKNSY
jgi:hypothetical protein